MIIITIGIINIIIITIIGIIIILQVCLQFRKRGRSRISFVGRQPGFQDVEAEVEDAGGHDADTYAIDDADVEVADTDNHADVEEGGVDDVLQDEYGEGDGGEGDQVYLFIFSNTLSLFLMSYYNLFCFHTH